MGLPVNIPWLDIEIVRGCFLNCRWCPLDKSKPYQFMKLDLYGKIINEMARVGAGYRQVDLFRGGEPFLYPDIKALLSILESEEFFNKTTICFFTNGMVIMQEQMKAIVESPLKAEIVFSIDGVGDKESFEYMRLGAQWETVQENIAMLSYLRKKAFYGGLKKIVISTIIPHKEAVPFSVPDREVIQETFKKEFFPLGVDEFQYRGIHRYNGQVIRDNMPPKGETHNACFFVKRGGISILVDGRVSACCGDLANKLILGDLKQETISEIYYGNKLISMRKAMLMGERSTLKICGDCDLQ